MQYTIETVDHEYIVLMDEPEPEPDDAPELADRWAQKLWAFKRAASITLTEAARNGNPWAVRRVARSRSRGTGRRTGRRRDSRRSSDARVVAAEAETAAEGKTKRSVRSSVLGAHAHESPTTAREASNNGATRPSCVHENEPRPPAFSSRAGIPGGLDELLMSLVRSVIRQELAHFFDTKLGPTLKVTADADRAKSGDEYIRTDEAARRAGVTAGTVREWVKAGKLRGHHAGRLLRVKVSELEFFLASGGASNVVDLDAEARRILAGGRQR